MLHSGGNTNRKKDTGKNAIGFLLITPWLIGLFVFKLLPLAWSLYMSFTDAGPGDRMGFVGLRNYMEILEGTSLSLTLRYAGTVALLRTGVALFFAYLLSSRLWINRILGRMLLVPSLLGTMTLAVLWRALFREQGVVNALLGMLGFMPVNFFSHPTWAFVTLVILRVWQFGVILLLLLSALDGLPQDLYEAACLEGADEGTAFRRITLPMLFPAVAFSLAAQMILALQEFTGPYMITYGGPKKATNLLALDLYNTAFRDGRTGMGAAESWVLLLLTLIPTGIAIISIRKGRDV